MEITIRNNQRLIRISQRRIENILKKVLKHLTLNHRRYNFIEFAEISVLFVNDRKMRELNLRYRGKDKTTDVLSFPQLRYSAKRKAQSVKRKTSHESRVTGHESRISVERRGSNVSRVTVHGHESRFLTHDAQRTIPLGDIVISLPRAKRQAKEYGVTFYQEISRLLIHGLLHLLGYDHEKNKYQARKMREMEREALCVDRKASGVECRVSFDA